MKLFALLMTLMSHNSFALPVLRESAGAFKTNFVTIYPDDRDPNKFYFMPNEMNFAVDPTTNLPRFSLLTYGVEQSDLSQSFGFMTFTFRAALTDDVRKELQNFQAANPHAVLATMPVAESYLSVGNSRDGKPSPEAQVMFKNWELPPYGGLLETEVGGNAYLTGIGAKMITGAIKNSDSQISQIQSCYTIDGVTPQMNAHISIDYQKVFEHFKAEASVGWWIFGADVAKEVTKLQEEGAISIVLNGDTKMEDMVMEMARELAKEYLVAQVSDAAGDVNLSGMPFRLVRFGFGSTTVEERHHVEYDLQKRSNITDVRCIAAPFSGLSPFATKLISNTPK